MWFQNDMAPISERKGRPFRPEIWKQFGWAWRSLRMEQQITWFISPWLFYLSLKEEHCVGNAKKFVNAAGSKNLHRCCYHYATTGIFENVSQSMPQRCHAHTHANGRNSEPLQLFWCLSITTLYSYLCNKAFYTYFCIVKLLCLCVCLSRADLYPPPARLYTKFWDTLYISRNDSEKLLAPNSISSLPYFKSHSLDSNLCVNL